MTIRRATLADQPELLRMTLAFGASDAYAPLVMFHVERSAEAIVDVLETGVIWVAELAGALVGMVAVVPRLLPFTGQACADEVAWWVEPAHRGTLGPQLMAVMLAWAREEGLEAVRMIAPARASKALGRYYRRLGFAEVETSYLLRLE